MQLVEAFVWSKVGVEAGLSFDAILRWKELQRHLGGGRFFWGIGNSIKPAKMVLAHQRSGRAEVLFSIQPSDAKSTDSDPSGVCLWSHFIDQTGQEKPLPNYACVTSKFSRKKLKHYALLCRASEPLTVRHDVQFDVGAYKNFGGRALGNSQVTAVVEQCEMPKPIREYRSGFIVALDQPYAVTLVKPKLLTPSEFAKQRTLMSSSKTTPGDLQEFLSALRAS